jgi:hypothetical protein
VKKAIVSIIGTAIKLLVISLLCDFIYEWTSLDKVFRSVISYPQWVGIVTIVYSLTPDSIVKPKEKNDEQGS